MFLRFKALCALSGSPRGIDQRTFKKGMFDHAQLHLSSRQAGYVDHAMRAQVLLVCQWKTIYSWTVCSRSWTKMGPVKLNGRSTLVIRRPSSSMQSWVELTQPVLSWSTGCRFLTAMAALEKGRPEIKNRFAFQVYDLGTQQAITGLALTAVSSRFVSAQMGMDLSDERTWRPCFDPVQCSHQTRPPTR